MNDLVVKNVDMFGDTIMAAMDNGGTIWVGVNYFCQGLEMNKKQRDWQIEKIREDKTLSRGSRLLPAGIFDASHEMYALRLDFVPLWLAKITITKKMEQDHPDLADKLLQYQLKAKDILAAAFMPQYAQPSSDMQYTKADIPVGEVARLSTVMDRIMVRQNSKPHDIARAFEMLCGQFGIILPDDFVKVPEYEQMTLDIVTR